MFSFVWFKRKLFSSILSYLPCIFFLISLVRTSKKIDTFITRMFLIRIGERVNDICSASRLIQIYCFWEQRTPYKCSEIRSIRSFVRSFFQANYIHHLIQICHTNCIRMWVRMKEKTFTEDHVSIMFKDFDFSIRIAVETKRRRKKQVWFSTDYDPVRSNQFLVDIDTIPKHSR